MPHNHVVNVGTNPPEPTAERLTEQISILYHQRALMIEKLAEIEPKPARLATDTFGWYTMQMHHTHDIVIRENQNHDIEIRCFTCSRTIAILESK